ALLKSEDPYGKDAYIASSSPLVVVGASLIPPVVEELTLGFTYKSAFEAVPRAISEANLGRIDHAHGGNVPVYPMRPFAPASVQEAGAVPAAFAGGHGLYLGFDRPFGEAHISWYFRLRDGFPSVDRPAESGEPLLAWEYLALDRAWEPLDVEDGTAHLTGSGTVAFAGPSDSLAAALFPAGPPPVRQSLHWFRARLVSGRYDYPPVLRGVYPNTVMADNRTTFRGDLVLGSGSGERGQRLRLPKAPVLSGTLWVRESE